MIISRLSIYTVPHIYDHDAGTESKMLTKFFSKERYASRDAILGLSKSAISAESHVASCAVFVKELSFLSCLETDYVLYFMKWVQYIHAVVGDANTKMTIFGLAHLT